jgi:hypothetical protein
MILRQITTKRLVEEDRMAGVISTEAQKDLLDAVAGWFGRHGRAGNLDETEALAEEAQRVVGQAILEAALLNQGGRSTYQGASVPCCSCNGRARFVNYRRRWVRTLHGEARILRAYYHCAACHTGQAPWDAAQGLSDKPASPRLKAAVSRVMGRLVYSDGVCLLEELCGVRIEESTAEAIVGEVGPRIRKHEQERVRQVKAQTERATAQRLMVDESEEKPVAALPTRPLQGERVYLGVDATTAHIEGAWHNVQNGLVFTVRADEEGRDTVLERAYLAGRMDMASLGWGLRALAATWNAPAYRERVFLADGAPCNWNLAATHFPDAVFILDFYHAAEHVWALGRALYRQDDPTTRALGERWVADRLNSLKKEGPKPLLRALARRKCETAAQREALRQARHYFKENAERMDYPAHLAAGRMIGSGPVEAACKSVVGVRLKQAGMRWSDAGADAVLAIRTTLLNGDSDRLVGFARAA